MDSTIAVLAALTNVGQTLFDIEKTTGLPLRTVSKAVQNLRRNGRAITVGTVKMRGRMYYLWKLGQNTSPMRNAQAETMVVQALQERPMTISEIVDECGIGRNTVNTVVRRLVSRKWVDKRGAVKGSTRVKHAIYYWAIDKETTEDLLRCAAEKRETARKAPRKKRSENEVSEDQFTAFKESAALYDACMHAVIKRSGLTRAMV